MIKNIKFNHPPPYINKQIKYCLKEIRARIIKEGNTKLLFSFKFTPQGVYHVSYKIPSFRRV